MFEWYFFVRQRRMVMSDIGDPLVGMILNDDPLFDFSIFEDELRRKKLEDDARLVATAEGWEFVEICGLQDRI